MEMDNSLAMRRKCVGFSFATPRRLRHPKMKSGWWLKMWKHVVKTITDHRNNVIKSFMIIFKGK